MTVTRFVPDSLWELFNVLEEGVICLSSSGAVLGWNKSATEFFAEDRGASRGSLQLEDLLVVRESEGLSQLASASEGMFQRTVVCHNEDIPVHMVLRPLQEVGPESLRVLIVRRGPAPMREEGASSIINFYSLLIHEVKNPLAAIKVLIQGVDLELSTLPQTTALRELLSGYLSRVNREIQRIVKLLDSVKYLSRLTSDRRTRYDLVKVARSVVSHYTPVLERHRVRSQLTAEVETAELYGDPDEMRQVLLNLLENALEAMTEGGGLLWVTVQPDGEGVLLSVADTGAGMTEEALARLYDQSDPFRSGGLSLSVARWIVARYKGRVSFLSQKGRGTTVRVWLPAVGAGSAEVADAGGTIPGGRPTVPGGRREGPG